jgi:hypothetical protein
MVAAERLLGATFAPAQRAGFAPLEPTIRSGAFFSCPWWRLPGRPLYAARCSLALR